MKNTQAVPKRASLAMAVWLERMDIVLPAGTAVIIHDEGHGYATCEIVDVELSDFIVFDRRELTLVH